MGAPKGHPPYPGCETGGRPLEWTEEYLNGLADHLLKWIEEVRSEKKFFWWKDWAFDVGHTPSCCAKMAKMNKKFLTAYNYAKEVQESQISKGALLKKCDSNFSQFYLKTQHPDNWKTQTDEELAQFVVNTVNYLDEKKRWDAQRNNASVPVSTEMVSTTDFASA